jgi:Domain of unknown function (DUF4129)
MNRMPRRPPATLADYLVVAITPTLIGLLVGSLMWFLIEVFYPADDKFVVRWVVTMFIIAIVGISRIAMEQGFAYASLFAFALAGALSLVLPPIGWPLLLLVWWAVHKLTWDATLIDDDQDASGQGLLEQMGLDPSADAATSPASTTSRSVLQEATSSAELPPTPPWWETLLEPDRRPHAPGVWVVYFSLAALPLFGIGGWFVPASDPVARARVFGLLVIYVASAMGLLLATSFLGLRRYLRQRKLEMPLEMTSTWIIVGVVMICAMLLVAALLPRPSREHSLSQLPFAITAAARKASRIAFLKEGIKDDTAPDPATTDARRGQETSRQGGKRGGQSDRSQQPAPSGQGQKTGGSGKSSGKSADGKGPGEAEKSQSSSGGDSKGGKQSGGSKGGDNGDKSKSQSAEANAEKRTDDSTPRSDTEKQASAEQQSSAPPPDAAQPEPQPPPSNPLSPSRVLSQVTSALSQLFGMALRWLFYAALLAGVVIAAWFYRDELISAWQKLLEELRELWESWFGGKNAAQPDASAEVVAPPRLFASFPDPFLTGNAARMSWPELVRYTFEALEAWGREHDCPRNPGQTAHEFAIALGTIEPDITSQVNALATWYSQLAYAPRSASGGHKESLRALWSSLAASV